MAGLTLAAASAPPSASAASITYFPLHNPGNAYDLTAGADGNLWVVGDNDQRLWIRRVTPTGAVTEFSSGITPSAPSSRITSGDIASGPDGQVWFTFSEPWGGGVARISPTGQVTTVYRVVPQSAPPSYGRPAIVSPGLTSGPDGNIWLTDIENDRVGRITPSGSATWFSVGNGPRDITVGPDGNLWFTESFANKIGRITPAGQVTELPTRVRFNEPTGITTGPDGNVWFSHISDRIGRITPAGRVTLFSQGITPSSPSSITAGPDGNLWFGESRAIARITPQGVVTEYPLRRGADEIVTGPDGNLWFIDWSRKRVGRVTPTAAPAPRVRILSRVVRVSARGVLKVRLGCGRGAGRCVGDLALARRGEGQARFAKPVRLAFSINARRREVVRLKLTKAALRLLDLRGRLPAKARAVTSANTARRTLELKSAIEKSRQS